LINKLEIELEYKTVENPHIRIIKDILSTVNENLGVGNTEKFVLLE